MLRVAAASVLLGALVSCDITCPDGSVCPDSSTCCETERGYSCCPYPKGVCCSDMAHCCPAGFRCNLATWQCERPHQPWMGIAMAGREAAQLPGVPLLPAAPIRQLRQTPMSAVAEARGGAREVGVIRCDSQFFCPQGRSCCKKPTGQWSCCPYPLGQCCSDGQHCCEYGYTCDFSGMSCTRWYSQIPSGARENAQTD